VLALLAKMGDMGAVRSMAERVLGEWGKVGAAYGNEGN
jgi:hypothetical protein